MSRTQLLCDVNLAAIEFANQASELGLMFLSMADGSEVSHIKCRGLLVLKYHTAVCELPLYVGEVNHRKFCMSEAGRMLSRLDYSFSGESGPLVHRHLDCLHYLHIEGGEVYIEIACEELCGWGFTLANT